MPIGDMDIGTKIVVLAAAIIGLGAAVVAYRTARLKHDNESRAIGGGGTSKKQPGPFDAMFAIMGAFGAVLGPILLFAIVVGVIQVVIAIPSYFQSGDHREARHSAETIDRKLLNPKEMRLFDLTETAAGMTEGNARSKALRHVVDLAIGEKSFLLASVAATKMQRGIARSEALTLVAIRAIENNDPVTANKAIRAMDSGNARNNTARKVMSILETQKNQATGTSTILTPVEAKK